MKVPRSLVLICALAACHRAAKPATAPEPVAASNGASCMASGGHDDLRRWRTVDAGNFTLCVPPDGQLSGSNWHRGSASVEWGVGEPPHRVVSGMVALPAGVSPSTADIPNSNVHRFSEVIDSRHADLWDNHFGNTYYTGATFTQPGIYLVGTASDPGSAEVELEMYRTVRFATH